MPLKSYTLSLRQTLITTGLLMLALYAGILLVYQHVARGQIQDELNERINSEMEVRTDAIKSSIAKLHQRIQFLYTTPPIQGIVRASAHDGIDPTDGTPYLNRKLG